MQMLPIASQRYFSSRPWAPARLVWQRQPSAALSSSTISKPSTAPQLDPNPSSGAGLCRHPRTDIGSEDCYVTVDAAVVQQLHSLCTSQTGLFDWKPQPILAPASSAITAPNAASNSEMTPAPTPTTGSEKQKPAVVESAEVPAVVIERTAEQCHVTNPSHLCCSTTTVERSADSVTVSVRTTVRMTEARPVSASDLEELAWISASESAAEQAAGLTQRSAIPESRRDRHAAICHMLKYGHVAEAHKQENGYGHVSYVVVLEDKRTKARMNALFKPRVEGDCEGWHRVAVEVVAYQLSLLLGMDVVPPAVYRPDCHVDWQHFENGGTFIYWCANARELSSINRWDWCIDPTVLLSNTRILDVLIQNSDRHMGHFLCAEHWADGHALDHNHQHVHSCSSSPQQQQHQSQQQQQGQQVHMAPVEGWRGRMWPVLIDHAAGFREGAYVSLDHDNAFMTGATRRILAKTYLRLRFLSQPLLESLLRGIISSSEISQMLDRKDNILKFFDSLVASEGYHNVVIEDECNRH